MTMIMIIGLVLNKNIFFGILKRISLLAFLKEVFQDPRGHIIVPWVLKTLMVATWWKNTWMPVLRQALMWKESTPKWQPANGSSRFLPREPKKRETRFGLPVIY